MTTTLFQNGGSQAVRIPKELRLTGSEVTIRRLGGGVYIEPLTVGVWPDRFFDAIRIEDDAFSRPEQGTTPSSPKFGE